jgi:surfactin synthase thioesterase subunit
VLHPDPTIRPAGGRPQIGQRSRWLLREPDPDAEARLFCLPFAGTGASSYRHWPSRLGPMELCPVQLPGRENRIREESYHDFEKFATDAADGLEPYTDRPYALFGHCMGALLGYALTVRLQETGRRLPDRLYVSSSLVPSRGFFGLFQPTMTDAELERELQRVVGVVGGGELLPELVPLAIRILRNDMDMCYRYAPPGPYPLAVPVTAVAWRDDPDVPPAEMTAWDDYYQDTVHHVVDGDALTYLTAPTDLLDVIEHDFARPAPTRAG